MIEIKVQCPCGTKYKFDVEPVNGLLPSSVQCPVCGVDGTQMANEILAYKLQATSAPPARPVARPITTPLPPPAPTAALATATPTGLKLSGAAHATEAGSPPVMPSGGRYGAGPKPLLERNIFFIKERVGLLKLTDTYDILDPTTSQQIGIAKEEPHVLAKYLRLVIKKHMMPTTVNIYEDEAQPPVASIHRGFTFLRSKIWVKAGSGQSLGYFKSKLFSFGGGFYVFDDRNNQVAEVKGDWKGWNFKFLRNGREIGTVTKKWAGLGRELFTSADNYVISLNDLGGTSPAASALLLAAGLAIDIVFKEAD